MCFISKKKKSKIPPETSYNYSTVAYAGGALDKYELHVGGKVPQLTNDQRSDAQIYAFALWHPGTIRPALQLATSSLIGTL